MKIYVTAPTLQMEQRVSTSLFKHFEGEVEVYVKSGVTSVNPYDYYEKEKLNILSSQILVCVIDPEHSSEDVTRTLATFTSSLDTLRELGVRHTPKLVVGLPLSDIKVTEDASTLFNLGAIYDWGNFAEDEYCMIDMIADYISENPM